MRGFEEPGQPGGPVLEFETGLRWDRGVRSERSAGGWYQGLFSKSRRGGEWQMKTSVRGVVDWANQTLKVQVERDGISYS